MSPRLLHPVATAFVLALSSSSAWAAGPPKKSESTPPKVSEEDEAAAAQAREAFERGTILYQAEAYEKAILAFEEAAALYASPDFQFNLGLCYERLGRWEDAILHFETYRRTERPGVDTSAVAARIEDLEAKRQAELDAAAAEAEAREKASQEKSDAQRRADAREDAAHEGKIRQGKIMRGVGYGLLGLGVATSVGTGVAFGVAVNEQNDALARIQSGGNPDAASFGEARVIADRARDLQTYEFIGIGVGAGVALVGGILVGVGTRQLKAERALGLRPHFSPRGAGLSLSGRF